ncbi:hypothetical protein [Conexibacter arvalis]|uniref:Uncharacterized protein n=1 Tax=Conexibacter arvalis TaxID=912552 RepID=A0A840IHB4_9ACTN|nr:hypothetical protein [Conexibacter arvalis]MBB4663621.1 hypothetical protein [Conexibacter arvalis]
MSGQHQRTRGRSLRRIGGAALALLLGLGAVALLILFLNSRDEAGVQPAGGAAAVPGTAFDAPERYLDGRQTRLLARGNVYLVAAGAPPALTALREELSGPPDPVLEEAGQAVVLVRRAGVDGVVALAAGHRLVTDDPADPRLERFAAHWLGRGAG